MKSLNLLGSFLVLLPGLPSLSLPLTVKSLGDFNLGVHWLVTCGLCKLETALIVTMLGESMVTGTMLLVIGTSLKPKLYPSVAVGVR